MTITAYADGGISPRTNVYAERQMLKHAKPVMVLEKLGLTKPMPKNKTDTIKFRRPRVFTAATTPLIEGVTPTETQFSYEDVSATLRQYGQVVIVTDKIEDLHEDPVLNDASVQAGENIGRTIEALNYGVVRAGTSVYYANGTPRTDVNTPITLGKQRAVLRSLKALKAQKITRSPVTVFGLRHARGRSGLCRGRPHRRRIRHPQPARLQDGCRIRHPLADLRIRDRLGRGRPLHAVAGPEPVPRCGRRARARWYRPAARRPTSTRSSTSGRTLGAWLRCADRALFPRRLFRLDRRPKTIRSASVATWAGRLGTPH